MRLNAVAGDRSFPAIVRATALSLIEHPTQPPAMAVVESSLQDPDDMVRRAAVGLLITWEPTRGWQRGGPLLSDPVRSVRIEALNALVDAAPSVTLGAEQRGALERAIAEYRDVQAYNADRADAWLNLGSLDSRLGNRAAAEAAYLRAIGVQPSFMPPYVNLADLYRQQGRDADGERVLRQALSAHADSADVHYALGLLLVRQQHRDEALDELGKAASLSPDSPRYIFVYAVALDSLSQRPKALTILEEAHRRFTGDRDILTALIQLSAQSGDRAAAARWAAALGELDVAATPHADAPATSGAAK